MTDPIVFAPDLLIAYLRGNHPQHRAARDEVMFAVRSDSNPKLSAANYTHLLLGPMRAGKADVLKATLADLRVEIVHVDSSIAELAAEVSTQTDLHLPAAFAIATARVSDAVLLSCDDAVIQAHRAFKPKHDRSHDPSRSTRR